MLTQPSQYELNKPDDYKQCLDKQVDAKEDKCNCKREKRCCLARSTGKKIDLPAKGLC
jgi:hypothetical protein